MDAQKMSFTAPGNYPVIGTISKNPWYAKEMLDNIGGCNSEMNAISLYVYNHLYEIDLADEISDIFMHIAMVEMHHLNIFGTLATKLGQNPRLWTDRCGQMVYWTPTYNKYPTEFYALMQNAITGEVAAIEKYQRQARQIDNTLIVDCLNRIIEDEEVHIHIFHEILEQYNNSL